PLSDIEWIDGRVVHMLQQCEDIHMSLSACFGVLQVGVWIPGSCLRNSVSDRRRSFLIPTLYVARRLNLYFDPLRSKQIECTPLVTDLIQWNAQGFGNNEFGKSASRGIAQEI